MKIKAVIFDQDGVLIDSEPIHFLALSKFFKEHNEKYSLAIHETYFGYSGHNFFTQMREKHGVSMTIEYMKSRSKQYIHEFESQIQLMPEVHSCLEELNQLVQHIGLATGTYRELTNRNLFRLNLNPFFKNTVCGDEVVNGKPDPEIYLKAAEKLKVTPKECLVVEDSPAGIDAAKKAGMTVISYLAKHNTKADLSKADHQIISLKEIAPFIKRFNEIKSK